MNDKEKNISKRIRGGFPQPEIPVEDAWKDMHSLLVMQGLTNTAEKKRRRWILILLLFFFIVVAGLVTWRLTAPGEKEANLAGLSNQSDTLMAVQNSSHEKLSKRTEDTSSYQSHIETKPKAVEDFEIQEQRKQLRKQVMAGKEGTTNKNDVADNMMNLNDISDEKKAGSENINNLTVTGPQKDGPEELLAVNNLRLLESDTGIIHKKNVASQKDTAIAKPAMAVQKKSPVNSRFQFGLQWDANFSFSSNSNYFKDYDGNNQYYMWLVPALWAKVNLNNKHSLLLQIDPYAQLFGGEKTLCIEKPLILSDAPDIVTKLLKTCGYSFGLQYGYKLSDRLSLAAGADYIVLQKALYQEQLMDTNSGVIYTQKIYAATKGNDDFRFMKSATFTLNASVKYNFKKISLGAGFVRPIGNIGSNDQFNVSPVNGNIYMQYPIR